MTLPIKRQLSQNEASQVDACLEAMDLRSALERGEIPVVEAFDMVPPGETCHFVSPVRFGRRRADQIGNLLFSDRSLHFRGTTDLTIAWSDVGSVRRDGCDIQIVLHSDARVLRFACPSYADAARGRVIAQHLASTARPDASRKPEEYQASA